MQVSRRQFGTGALGVAFVGALAACTRNDTDTAADPTGTPTTSGPTTPAVPPAAITVSPASGTAGLNPHDPITVTSVGGSLTTVSLVNADGKAVQGSLSPDQSTWTLGEPLGYSRDYTLTATATNPVGVPTTTTATFTTVKPSNMTMPYINTRSGFAITEGGTYGVGMVVRVRFDEPIPDRAAAEKALVVTTTPAVEGSWSWIDDRNVLYRPKDYYPSGTKVAIKAKVYGVQVGPGLYGQADTSVSFTIGQKRVSIADDRTKHVAVYFDDVLQRSMPTSMGKGGYVTGSNGEKISFFTPAGTYTVLGKANPVLMDSSTYGLPVNSPEGYKEYINWATQISTDGIYLHELQSTIWAQGNANVSHGCLNLSHENATWFYQNAQVGDVVQIQHTGGDPLAQWQNGDWSVPWDQWLAKSALR